MRKQTFTSKCGKQYVCRSNVEVAKFLLFVVSVGKVELKGKPPRLKKNNPKVKRLINLKRELDARTKA